MTTDDTAMKALVIEAMYKGLDEKKREELLKSALNHLLTPPPSTSYTRSNTTPLQDAWNQAVWQIAQEATREHVKNDPKVKEQIQTLLTKAMAKVWANEDTVVNQIADGIISAMRCHLDR